jgi:hypothetical protein
MMLGNKPPQHSVAYLAHEFVSGRLRLGLVGWFFWTHRCFAHTSGGLNWAQAWNWHIVPSTSFCGWNQVQNHVPTKSPGKGHGSRQEWQFTLVSMNLESLALLPGTERVWKRTQRAPRYIFKGHCQSGWAWVGEGNGAGEGDAAKRLLHLHFSFGVAVPPSRSKVPFAASEGTNALTLFDLTALAVLGLKQIFLSPSVSITLSIYQSSINLSITYYLSI